MAGEAEAAAAASGGGGGGGGAGTISAIGNILGGIGAFQSSRARAKALKAAALQARRDGSIDAEMATDEAERIGAEAAVRGAAGGGGFDGSFAGVMADLERTGVFNARSAIYAGNAEANNRLYEAKVAKMDGNMQLLTSVFQASSTLASTQMQGAERRKQADYRQASYRRGG